MNDIVISAAKALLQKNISFCIFRFPEENTIHLAIDPQYFTARDAALLMMMPFTPESRAENITLKVVNDGRLIPTFLEKIDKLPSGQRTDRKLPAETTRQDYFRKMDVYLEKIREGDLQKAILSRVIHFPRETFFDPTECFINLNSDYPNTFNYLLFHPRNGMWAGATPELLLKKRGNEYETIALAGTRERIIEKNYHWREKEIEEHRMVEEHIESIFKKHDFSTKAKKGPYTIEAGSVAHLRTDYTFLKQGETDLDNLLSDLHPTPAVGGWPVAESLDFIKQNEGYDRKYYTGIIGIKTYSGDADFYVNLRCMQIGKKEIAVFAGGGITADSAPEEEWEETIMKSKTMADKIGLVKEWN